MAKLIIIAGPTGVGKTAYSLQLAERIDGEIISADSMQVYRGMDIGTAKVSVEDRARIVHHCIDVRGIDESFHVYDFVQEAEKALSSIYARGKTAIVVGGTGLYIHSLLYGAPDGPAGNAAIRACLSEQAAQYGAAFLYRQLQAYDPLYAASVMENDCKKIVRALEIIQVSGKKVSDFMWKERPMRQDYDICALFFYKPIEELYRIINVRVEQMVEHGLFNEVSALEKQGLRDNPTAAMAIGYRQVLQFFDGPKTPHDAAMCIESIQRASRQYAKRQCTWFRKEPLFTWVSPPGSGQWCEIENLMPI